MEAVLFQFFADDGGVRCSWIVPAWKLSKDDFELVKHTDLVDLINLRAEEIDVLEDIKSRAVKRFYMEPLDLTGFVLVYIHQTFER